MNDKYKNYSTYSTVQVTDPYEIFDVKPAQDEPENKREFVGFSVYLPKVINCLFLNVRKYPTTDSKVIHIVKSGTSLHVDYNDGEWSQVTLDTGHVGYVMNKFLDI